MATNSTSPAQRQYLSRVLGMNPMWESSALLQLRRELLHLKRYDQTESASDAEKINLAAKRDAARRVITQIQSDFWKVPIDQLQRSLHAIDCRAMPEFLPVYTRLKTASACRGEFPNLTQLKGMDMELFRAFKTAVVLPPADAGRVREKFIRSIQDRKRLKEVQVATKLIESKYPILYALERDWFTTLKKMKKPKAQHQESGESWSFAEKLEIPWYFWWGLIIVIRIILTGMRSDG